MNAATCAGGRDAPTVPRAPGSAAAREASGVWIAGCASRSAGLSVPAVTHTRSTVARPPRTTHNHMPLDLRCSFISAIHSLPNVGDGWTNNAAERLAVLPHLPAT